MTVNVTEERLVRFYSPQLDQETYLYPLLDANDLFVPGENSDDGHDAMPR